MALLKQLRQVVGELLRYAAVSLLGTAFSLPLYRLLRNETSLGVFWASPISNAVAQAIDFLPHKLFSFKERRLESKVLSLEFAFYTLVVSTMMVVEPILLNIIEHRKELSPVQAWLVIHPFTGTARFILYRMIFKWFHTPPAPISS